jgi:hypothetical protein
MNALLRQAQGLWTPSAIQARNLWAKVLPSQDADRVASRVNAILYQDGTFKSVARNRFHEKGWQKRKRKVEERTIRHANRKVGSMIDFILKRKKA